MKRVLLCCGGGFSSSALVNKVKKEIIDEELETEYYIEFSPFSLAYEKMNNFDIEIDEVDVDIQIPQEELDEVFSNMPDLEEEEEEWNRYRISGGDNGFAQGVTFEELSSVGALLQKENLEQSQKETAVDIVQRLQGTELFSLLENSVEGASRKIAELLDSTLSSENEDSSSNLRKSDLNDFDIGEFI